jgi:hypothetical protein
MSPFGLTRSRSFTRCMITKRYPMDAPLISVPSMHPSGPSPSTDAMRQGASIPLGQGGYQRSSTLLVCLVLLSTTPALAHRPYERVAGTFQRADGTSISIVRHWVDGILGADPVSIQFRLPDGAEIARTRHIFDAVVQPVGSGVEVYQFRTTWLPVASRVDGFDGYRLTDITSSRRARSIAVHFVGHWVGYLVTGGLAAFLGVLWNALRSMPNRGWRAAFRWVGFAFVGFAGFFFVYDLLVFEAVSPPVLGACGVIVWALVRLIRSKRQAIAG